MAMLFFIVYPGGERAIATGYPGQVLTVLEVPRGPECCYLDEVEVDFAAFSPANHGAVLPVRRVVGGPRRPTHHVRIEADRDAWMDARDAEGWQTNTPPGDGSIVWIVADRDGLDIADLERTGAIVIGSATDSG